MHVARLVVALLALAPSLVAAALVPTQPRGSCAVAWDVAEGVIRGDKPRHPWRLFCLDGDSSCDVDGTLNGECALRVGLCVEATGPSCSGRRRPLALRLSEATSARLDGLVPPPLGQGAACGTPGTVIVSEGSPVLLDVRSRSRRRRERNRLELSCAHADCFGCVGGDGAPRALIVTASGGVSDLDLGWTGGGHNLPLVTGWRTELCLSGCDGATDPVCDGTPPCTTGGRDLLGPPQPIVQQNVPMCLVTRRQATQPTATVDLASGALTMPLAIETELYVSGFEDCPRCSGSGLGTSGVCSGGLRRGRPCIVDGRAVVRGETALVSSECLPDVGELYATVSLTATLTTGQALLGGSPPCPGQGSDPTCACTHDCADVVPIAGGLNQTCCAGDPQRPCFAAAIVRDGVPAIPLPAWPAPEYPKSADGRLVATSCVPASNSPLIDGTLGLPGPAAVVVPVTLEVAGP